MRQTRQGNGARPKHDQRRERPHRAAKLRPGPFGLRGSLPPLAARNRISCFGRAARRKSTALYDGASDKLEARIGGKHGNH